MGFNPCSRKPTNTFLVSTRPFSRTSTSANNFLPSLELPLVPMTVQILDALVGEGSENMDVRDKEQLVSRMKAAVASKHFGLENIICSDPFYYEKVVW